MRKDLSEWELSLKPYINHIKLLGEIPITHIEVEHIGNLIRDLKNQYNQRRATFLLETKYPFTFVMYLASLAAHNTDRDYWRVVSESTGFNIQRMRQLEWGPIFLKILKDNNLPTFHSVGGYRYVTPIRLHGGIPAYSLPDFFGYILWPSITRQSYKNLSSKDVVNGILKRTTVQISVDSPVTNFLENGGEYAIEFFDRCRQMARRYNQSQDIPDPIEINLPPYVVRSFQQFVEEELETDTGRRLRAPQLFIDPWGPDFYINLPPEPVDALQSTHHYHWQVEMHMSEKENHTLTEPVRVRRRGYDLETSDLNIPLENPAEHIIVSYCNQDSYQKSDPKKNIKTIRRWRLNLLPDEEQPPLLAFNPLNGRLIRWQQTLPAEELWLVSPNDVEIHLDGEGEVIETFPDFFGAWGQWSVESWDLSQSISIQLKQNGKGIKAPIPILSAPPEPVLVGNNTLRNDVDPDGVPVYIGESPSIRFPIRPGRHADTELSSWQLKIESRWAASPEFHHELFQISEFKSNIHALSNEFEFPLSTLLGSVHADDVRRPRASGHAGNKADANHRSTRKLEPWQ